MAHRLRTIYDSDLIICLKEGSVAESGTHEQLVDCAGLYSQLWSVQETLFTDEKEVAEDQAKEPTKLK